MPRTAAAPLRRGAPPDRAAGPSAVPAAAPETVLQLLRRLGTSPRGLTEAEAERRLLHRESDAAPPRFAAPARRLADAVRDPFTAVLAVLGAVSLAVSAWTSAAVILALVVTGCVLRALGEHRADRSAEALRALVADTATVVRRRGGAPAEREIPADQLVPGDIVRIGAGDLVPADMRLLRATGLTVNQAALTGESAPAAKHPADAPDPAEGTRHLCHQGSSVATGSATAVVTAAGADTLLASAGRIPGGAAEGAAQGGPAAGGVTADGRPADGRPAAGPGGGRAASAFDRSVRRISWALVRAMLITAPLVLLADRALHGHGSRALAFAVAVAVGLTPEMLSVTVVLALARAATALARTDRVIVKRLPALHDLGAMDLLCLDKTGTLTEDRPALDCHLDADGRPDPDVLHWAAVNSLWTLQLAETPVPDALDEAVLDGAGDDAALLDHEGVDALPFDPVRRLSTAVVRGPEQRLGIHTLAVKGDVDAVLERCAAVRTGGRETPLDDAARTRIRQLADERAADGLRLLAVARADRPARRTGRPYRPADERGLTLLGLIGLRDAPAETAPAALTELARHGIGTAVLTGDRAATAARACRDLGLPDTPLLSGPDIDALDDAELTRRAPSTAVFAGCTPEHKARVVRALRAAGHITGCLGDGVNDVPALHAADVGISPRGGVAAAREAADVVLAAKGLTAAARAVLAGRGCSARIADYLRITLSSNLGNVVAMLAAALLLPFLPMLPGQVLAQNLCFDAAQLAFALDRSVPAGALRRPVVLQPRAFLRSAAAFGAINAAADLATFAVLAAVSRGAPASTLFHSGWFTENLITQALVTVLLHTGRRAALSLPAARTLAAGRRIRAAVAAIGPVRASAAGLAAVGLVLPLTPLAAPLGLAPLPPAFHLLLAAVLTLYAAALTAARRRLLRGNAPAGGAG